MKKLGLKLLSVIAAVVMLFSFTACDQLVNEINSALEQLQKAVDEINNLIEQFEEYNFVNILDGDGTVTEEWVGTELEEGFTQPDSVVNFVKGYYETNDNGSVYSNAVELTSMAEADAYVQYLKGLGYDAYSDLLTWDAYNLMLAANAGKLCMALTNGENYVQVAYLEGQVEGFNAVFAIANYNLLDVAADEPAQEETPAPEAGSEAE